MSLNRKTVNFISHCPTVTFNSRSPWKSSRSWKRKHFLMQILWQEPCGIPSSNSQVYYQVLLQEKRNGDKCSYNSSEDFFFCVASWRPFPFSFVSPTSPVILFKFSTQPVFTAAKCPTKPAEFSEPAQIELLVSSFLCLLSQSCGSCSVYTVSIWVPPGHLRLMIRECKWQWTIKPCVSCSGVRCH